MAKQSCNNCILLNAESEKLWTKLKQKFKYASDSGFLLFLLDLAERELFWRRREKRRRKKGNVANQSSGANELLEVEKKKCKFSYSSRSEYRVSNDRKKWKKKKIVAVKFKYLGGRNYEAGAPLNNKSLTDSNENSSVDAENGSKRLLNDRSSNTGTTKTNQKRAISTLNKQVGNVIKKEQSDSILSESNLLRLDATQNKNVGYREILDHQTGDLIKVYEDSKVYCKSSEGAECERRRYLSNDDSNDFLRDLTNSTTAYDQATRFKSESHFNCAPQSSSLAYDEQSDTPFAEFSEQIPRFDTQGGTELMAVLGPQGQETNQYGSFSSGTSVSSALTGFGGDPNLNSTYLQYSGKLLSTDDSMLIHFDGEQNIEHSSEYSQSAVATTLHSFVGKSTDVFLGNNDPADGSFLNFDGKETSDIGSMDEAQEFEADEPHQRIDTTSTNSPLAGFGEEVKTKFTDYHGKILNTELPKNILADCDGDESEACEFSPSLDDVKPLEITTRHISEKCVPPSVGMLQDDAFKSALSYSRNSFLRRTDPVNRIIDPLKEEILAQEEVDQLQKVDMEASNTEISPHAPSKNSNRSEFQMKWQQKAPRTYFKRQGINTATRPKCYYSRTVNPVPTKTDSKGKTSILPKFLGKSGSELMSVKFKSHLLAESLLGHAPTCGEPSEKPLVINSEKTELEFNEDGMTSPNLSQFSVSSPTHLEESNQFKTLDVSKTNAKEDNPVEVDETLPPDFKLKIIDPKHGPSVISLTGAPAGHDFGPVKGFIIAEKEIPDGCDMRGIWQLELDGASKFLSTRDPQRSNWLRHVRPASRLEASNCLTTSIGDELFFRTRRPISEEEELLYWTVDGSSKGMKKRLGRTSCGTCNLKFAHSLYFRIHCLIFHDPELRLNVRKYFCKICGLPFVKRDTIVEHAISAHQGRGAYQCIFCSKWFLKGKSLESHKNYGCSANPRRSKPQCELCGQTFCQPQKLMTHKRRMHSCMEEVIKEFQCQSCKKILGSNAGLIRHKNEVHSKNFAANTCDRCGKVFPNKTNLKVHMLTHSGLRPYKCEIEGCSAAYTSKQGLQSHYKRVHNLIGDDVPKIERTVEYTFDAYCGAPKKSQELSESEKINPVPATAPPSELDDQRESIHSEAASPLSVGCSLDAPLTCVRPCSYGSEASFTTKENMCGSEPESECEKDNFLHRRNAVCDNKDVKRWLFRNENSTAGFLVDEAISAVEKDIGKELSSDLASYDGLRPYGSSPPPEVPRDFLKITQSAPRDYNISSLIRDEDGDARRVFANPNKDSQICDDRSRFYRDSSRDDIGEYRRTDFYRRDGYDLSYSSDRNSEAQNLCLKEKGLQLDLSYKGYEGFDDLNRDTTGLDGLLATDQGAPGLSSRPLQGLSPRYHPSYEGETVDLTLPRMPYPSSPIYPPLDIPGRFDLSSGISLLDFRNHLGLSPHRFSGPRVVSNSGNTSPPTGYPVYQPQYPAAAGRHSPTPPFHPYSAYY